MANKKQTTGSFFGDLMKAIKAGGSSKLLKNYKIKKNDTASTIAKKEGITLRQLMSLNPGYRTGQSGTPSKGTVKQKTMSVGSTIKIPDPQTFKNFRLTPVSDKYKQSIKKPVYKTIKKKEFKEMNEPLKRKRGAVSIAKKKVVRRKKK
jgi:hypothetical protein|tara:strand:+ start:4455 stop:4901 length:447 start_codon:yes stop_codon:yes gene_type:complete